MIMVGAILVTPAGVVPELTLVRFGTLSSICRKLTTPGLEGDQESHGHRLLSRLVKRADRPFTLEIITGVLMAAQLCGRGLDCNVRAIIAVVEFSNDRQNYPVRVFRDPFDYDLTNADEVSRLVKHLVQTSGEDQYDGLSHCRLKHDRLT
jgi:hypothetical protein